MWPASSGGGRNEPLRRLGEVELNAENQRHQPGHPRGDGMSQVKVLGVWPIGKDRTVFDLAEALGDMSPNDVHRRIRALRRWGQVARVGSVRCKTPRGGSPRVVYRRLW